MQGAGAPWWAPRPLWVSARARGRTSFPTGAPVIADVRACCVLNPAQHDETSASGRQSTTPSPERRGRGSTRLPVRASSRCCRWGSPLLRCRTIRLVSAALFEMRDEWIALPRRHLPEGDMGDICRKLSFGSSVLSNAPKCSRQLIPNSMTRDTTWRMRVPGRVALASVSSRAGHRRPSTQRLLGS